MTQVSTNCKNYMAKSRRRATCFPDYKYGNVQGIRVWKITGSGSTQTQTIHTSFVPIEGSVRVCKSMYLNMEAFVEPCVLTVRLDIWGPNNYYKGMDQEVAPYAIYGDNLGVLKGQYLSTVGLYTLWVAPDGDRTKEWWFDINVDNC